MNENNEGVFMDINSGLILETEVSENGEQWRTIHDTEMPCVSYCLAVSSYALLKEYHRYRLNYPWSAVVASLAKWVS